MPRSSACTALEIGRGIEILSHGQREFLDAAHRAGCNGAHRCRKRVGRRREPSGRRLPRGVEIATRRMRDDFDETAEVDNLLYQPVNHRQDRPETGVAFGTVEDCLAVIEPLRRDCSAPSTRSADSSSRGSSVST